MIGLAGIYVFGYRLALASLPKKSAFQMLLEPCTYWRNVEVPTILESLDIQRGDKVLDVGSPKLLSLFLASRLGLEVWATDLFPYFLDDCAAHAAKFNFAGNYHPELQDARKLSYQSNFFNKIFAISVIEHIEDQGDSTAMSEIARVLQPGGLCCLTVPVSDPYCEMHTQVKLYYKTEHQESKPVFWQRKYDLESLHQRLIEPSGMEVVHLSYYGERVKFEHFYNSLPKMLKIAFAPLGVLASTLCLYSMPNFNSGSKTALLVLRKRK